MPKKCLLLGISSILATGIVAGVALPTIRSKKPIHSHSQRQVEYPPTLQLHRTSDGLYFGIAKIKLSVPNEYSVTAVDAYEKGDSGLHVEVTMHSTNGNCMTTEAQCRVVQDSVVLHLTNREYLKQREVRCAAGEELGCPDLWTASFFDRMKIALTTDGDALLQSDERKLIRSQSSFPEWLGVTPMERRRTADRQLIQSYSQNLFCCSINKTFTAIEGDWRLRIIFSFSWNGDDHNINHVDDVVKNANVPIDDFIIAPL